MIWYIAKKLQDVTDVISHIFTYILREFVGMKTLVKISKAPSLEKVGNWVWWISLGRNLPPQFNTLFEVPGVESGRVRWFGKAHARRRSDPIIFLLHGGGYGFGMSLYHGLELKELYDDVQNQRLSMVWLDYTTTATARFPRQLEEAMAVYRELTKISDNIVILGDSAGGHLSLLVCREAHREKLPKPSSLILISPLCYLEPEHQPPAGSHKSYHIWDVTGARSTNEFVDLLLPTENPEVYKDIKDLRSKHDWEQVLPPADRILVTYGEYETMQDDTLSFIKNAHIKENGGSIYVEPKGVHDSPVFRGCGSIRLGGNPVVKRVSDFLKEVAFAPFD